MIAAGTTFQWQDGRDQVVARLLAQRDTGRDRCRVVLIDAADRLFVADVGNDHRARLITGPVTVQQALDKAEAVLTGRDHGSVTDTVMTMAVGLAGMVYLQQMDGGEG